MTGHGIAMRTKKYVAVPGHKQHPQWEASPTYGSIQPTQQPAAPQECLLFSVWLDMMYEGC